MENVVSNFESPEISIKLTDEKLYIKTLSSSETFALRSINGIGIVDLIDKYNVELTAQKNAKKPTGLYILGGFLILAGIGNLAVSIGPALIFIILGAAVFYWASTQQAPEPTLKSALLLRFNAARLRHYTSLSTWPTYGKGWTNRVAANLEYGAADDEAPEPATT